MANELIIPIAPVKLARAAWLRIAGLLVLGLAGALGLGFYGHQLRSLYHAQATFRDAAAQFQARTEAIHRLSDMELAFNRYILDGNPANADLLQADKQLIERLALDNVAQHDQLFVDLVAAEQKWYSQTVQPIQDERRKLAPGQGLPEDFLAKYRGAGHDLQLSNFATAAQNAHRQAAQALEQSEQSLRRLWLPYLLAGLLAIGVIWLGAGAIRRVSHLKQAAENAGEEEEEEDHKEKPHDEEGK